HVEIVVNGKVDTGKTRLRLYPVLRAKHPIRRLWLVRGCLKCHIETDSRNLDNVVGPVGNVVASLDWVAEVYIAQIPCDKPLPVVGKVLLVVVLRYIGRYLRVVVGLPSCELLCKLSVSTSRC
ncbi:MAG: hypothetical protein KGL32_09220, partial [candidate division NC10 bacterium]|nr:hypothetical protein [candidate division NC10 bacterium]